MIDPLFSLQSGLHPSAGVYISLRAQCNVTPIYTAFTFFPSSSDSLSSPKMDVTVERQPDYVTHCSIFDVLLPRDGGNRGAGDMLRIFWEKKITGIFKSRKKDGAHVFSKLEDYSLRVLWMTKHFMSDYFETKLIFHKVLICRILDMSD